MAKKKKATVLTGTVIEMVTEKLYVTALPLGAIEKSMSEALGGGGIRVQLYNYDNEAKTMTFSGKTITVMIAHIMTLSEIPYLAVPK